MSKKRKKIEKVAGMRDILPEEQKIFEAIERSAENMANFYGFKKISPPLLEKEKLFLKTTGEATDVVEKQMYTFKIKGEDKIALRPEFTPSLARIYIEKFQEEPKPVRFFSKGPLFRHERPQRKRYRQFHQFDFESFGVASPIEEALLLQIALNILEDLSLKDVVVEVNSLGCEECQKEYLKELKKYYKKNLKKVCKNCKKRFAKNPLRLLDCKEEKCERIKKFAPKIEEFLCNECENHFNEFLFYLKEMKINFEKNPYLVRGLDYYTKTVFEIFSKDDRKNALIAGGRYDNLVEKIGGISTPAVGMAGGIERIADTLKEKNIIPHKRKEIFEKEAKFFLISLGKEATAFALNLLETFKKEKIKVLQALSREKLRVQLKIADKLKVPYVLILGEEEKNKNEIILRNMANGVQEIIPLKDLIKKMKKLL